jgi:hypothetical protein
MSEGNVYPCRSKKTKDGYLVWLEKRPQLKALGESLDDALQELSSVVCLRTGDGEAVFDLVGANGKGEVGFVTLHYNARWNPPRDFSQAEFASLFEGGLCEGCWRGVGPRTRKVLRVGSVGTGDLLGPQHALPNLLVASDRFRKRLNRNERDLIEWRPIEMTGKSRTTYFELVGRHAIKTVAIRSERIGGWQCPVCRFRLFIGAGYHRTLVAGADLPRPLPPLLAIDSPFRLEIAIPAARWKRIRGKTGMKNIVTRRLVAVPEKDAVRKPKLRLLKKSGIARIRWSLNWALSRLGKSAREIG